MADPILYRIPIRIVRVPVQRRTRPVRNNHYCYHPLSACPHHHLASSSSRITLYEEEAALTDLLYNEEGSF